MPRPQPFKAGEPISARKLNLLVVAVIRALKWRVKPPLLLREDADGFFLSLGKLPGPQWFYTTSAIPSATATATGTALASATTTPGKGTARRCLETADSSGVVTRVPDPNAQDVTIYNPVVMSGTTTSIATGSLVRCTPVSTRWEIDMTVRCPGP